MKTMVLQLPSGGPAVQAGYGLAWVDPAEAHSRLQPQWTPLALLPRPGRGTEVVALVPASALSWHRVTLPPGLGRAPARLQAALMGLLEERVLQEPQQLQLALAPDWQPGIPTWVAVCDQAWLLAHLQALEAAGLAVQRVVPELAPPAQGEVWRALGDAQTGWLWRCSAEQGVCGWPLASAAQLPADWLEGRTLLAEPAVVGWAEGRAGAQAALVDSASHWREALDSGWNLAQFALRARLHAGPWHRLRRLADGPLRQPRWRAARWGLVALLLVQAAGLQAWAWMAERQWQDRQAQWAGMLQQSFPQVKVVVDAPVQMAREVERLRQGSGQLAAEDFEAQLKALGQAWPAGTQTPTRLSYRNAQLEGQSPALDAAQAQALTQGLQARGYRLAVEGEGQRWRLQAQEGRP